MPEIDWTMLRERAHQACTNAYAPYSDYPVGAAALTEPGNVIVGCNVENASYGLTLCAECAIVSTLVTQGGGRLVAITCSDSQRKVITPCGRCRQLLWEHGGPNLLVDTPGGPTSMRYLLPHAFGHSDLDRVRGGSTP
ncbi:MAG TPA: cytidine deaminase [Beutenbergiaceae bacterium]|nr:cytidine deaminase [Beutenbergiaceae bacterium]